MGLKRSRIAQKPSKVVGRGKVRGKRSKAPTLAKLKKQAWDALSEFVRRSEADNCGWTPCYTCTKINPWRLMHAGHAIPGRTGAVLLDREIIRTQCPSCNLWGHGRYEIFATKLIEENGMAWWKKKLQDSRQVKKWNRSDLESIRDSYREKIAQLETMEVLP